MKDRIVEERIEQRRAYDFCDRKEERETERMNREHVMIYMPMVVMVVVVFVVFDVLVVFLPLISSISCVIFHFTHGIEKRDTRQTSRMRQT